MPDTDNLICRVCGKDTGHARFSVREMYFGSKEPHDYFECSDCGAIQIANIPTNLSDYYPSSYYSLKVGKHKSHSAIVTALRSMRANAWLLNSRSNAIGRFLKKLSRRKPKHFDWFDGLQLTTESRILDVGCGTGGLLKELLRDGFFNIEGSDPFISETIELGHGASIYKRSLEDDCNTYDLIMMHHSLEHMPDPNAVMHEVSSHLELGGYALIRTPIAGCYAWRTYRQHWFQLDAPRHLVIQSHRSFEILAKNSGLEIVRFFFDSKSEQFIASECYKNDIPFRDIASTPHDECDLRRYELLTKKLNEESDGDQCGVILRKTH